MMQKRTDSLLGRLLRKARREAALTQGALAALAGCSARSLWQAERGQGHAEIYLRLVAALNLEVTGRSLPSGDHLGDRLRVLRQRLGVSLREISEKAGISTNTLSAIERGDVGHLAAVERVAEVLGAGLALVRAGEQMAFFTSAGISAAYEAWATPPDLLKTLTDALGQGFDLDPCSPGALRSRVPAVRHYTEADDGLVQPWHGRVFMNPPYGRGIGAWVARARTEVAARRAEFVIGLLPARTDTRWWHSNVAGHAHVWLLKGRLSFGDGATPAPFPSALVFWGGSHEATVGIGDAFHDAQWIPRARKAHAEAGRRRLRERRGTEQTGSRPAGKQKGETFRSPPSAFRRNYPALSGGPFRVERP